jgi:SEC-C motif-containing protein
MLCPCHSNKLHTACCKPFHAGEALPKNALELMRSRYSAYALELVQYIIDTTYLAKPPLKPRDILAFCKQTQFLGLEILEFVDGKETASVTFRAILAQGLQDVSFREKSLFVKVNDRWLYSIL